MINFKQTTAVNRQILRDSTHTNSVNFMILSGKKVVIIYTLSLSHIKQST